MKFLKQKNISRWSVSDDTLFANQYGRAVMDLTGGLRVPKGTTAQRPNVSGVKTPNGANGFIRYNTDINPVTGAQVGLEAYIDGVWEVVKSSSASAIYKQTLGPGDDSTTIFGPLDIVPVSDDSILVLVENVLQISVSNFNVLYNHVGTDAYIQFNSAVPSTKYITIFFGFSS